MPRKKSAATLKQLCLVAVMCNMDMLCEEHKQDSSTRGSVDDAPSHFNGLPWLLRNAIVDILNKNKLLKLSHLRQLLQPQATSLSFSDYEDQAFCDGLTEVITTRCHKLEILNLSGNRGISPNVLNQLPQSLPRLQVLSLRGTRVLDAMLSALSHHCHDLRELDISDCCRVSDAGIEALCSSHHREDNITACSKLHTLFMSGTSVTESGVLKCLKLLPALKHLQCSHVSEVLCEVFQSSKKAKLETFQLEELVVRVRAGTPNSFTFLEAAAMLCPNVVVLELVFEQPLLQDFSSLFRCFRNLHELLICSFFSVSLPFDRILAALQVVGHGLKSLELRCITGVDVYEVGKCCPQLQSIVLADSTAFSTSVIVDNRSFFSYLRELELRRVVEIHHEVPCSHLLYMLSSSHKLQSLQVSSCDGLTDWLMTQVLQVNCLHHLTCIEFSRCANISIESIIALMKLDSPLCTITLELCRSITAVGYDYLLKVAEDEHIDIDIEWIRHRTRVVRILYP